MLAKSLFKVLESRVASVGHWRPELLPMRGGPFLENLYEDTGRRDLRRDEIETRSATKLLNLLLNYLLVNLVPGTSILKK